METNSHSLFLLLGITSLGLVIIAHMLRGRITLAPVYVLGAIFTFLLWELRQFGWWIEWGEHTVDAALVGMTPPVLLGLVLLFAMDGLLAARAYLLTVLGSAGLVWLYSLFRLSLAQDIPLNALLEISTVAQSALFFALIVAMVVVLLWYALLQAHSRILALAGAVPIGMLTMLAVSAMLEYGFTTGMVKVWLEVDEYLGWSLIPAIMMLGYAVFAKRLAWFMPTRPVKDVFSFWRKTESNLSEAHQDVLAAREIISELRQLNNELEEAKRINEYQLQHSPLATMHTNTQGLITFANPAAKYMISNVKLIGGSILDYLQSKEGSGAGLFPPHSQTGTRMRLLDGDKEERWVRVDTMPLFDAEGKVTGLYLQLEEVTEHVLGSRRRRIEQKLKGIQQSSRMIAHDFSNQMLAQEGLLGQLRVAYKKQDDVGFAEVTEAAFTSVSRCREMLKTFGDSDSFSRPTLELLNLSTVLHEALAIHHAQAQSVDVKLTLQTDEGLWVQADTGQISRIFTNLIANALRASPAGSEIAIRANAQKDGMVQVLISDQGCGMTQEQMASAFEPGFSTKGAGQGGLGLAIVYLIMEAHGGNISLAPNPDGGITVQLLLPMVNPQQMPESEEPCLLLALQSVEQLEALADACVDYFDQVLETGNPQEFQALLEEEEHWDVLVCDFKLSTEQMACAETLIRVDGADLRLEKGKQEWLKVMQRIFSDGW